MAGFDRSKFKPTAKETIEKQEKGFSRGFDRSILKIETGENVVRAMPYHPDGGGESFAEAKSVVFLDISVPKKDENGNKIEDQFETKARPIFNAKVHGGYPFDIVEEFRDFAKKRAIPEYAGGDQGKVNKLLNKIDGNAQTKDRGIKYQDAWVIYACKAEGKDAEGNWNWGDIGQLDLKKSIKDLMTEKAAELDNPDPYSDPDEGIAFIVSKAKDAKKPSDWYKLKLDTKVLPGQKYPVPVSSPITDGQLEALSKLKSLNQLFVNSFKHSDLEKQLEGLKNFEESLQKEFPGFSVFQYDEFLSLVEKMYELVPEDSTSLEEDVIIEDSQEESKPEPPKSATKIERPAPTSKPSVPIKQEVKATKEEVEVKVPDGNAKDKLNAIRARLGKS